MEKQDYFKIQINLSDAQSILDILSDKPVNLGRLRFLKSMLEEKLQYKYSIAQQYI